MPEKPLIFLAFANDKELYKMHTRPNLAVENTEISKILKEKNIPFEVLPSFKKADFLRIFAEKGNDFQIFHYGGHGEKDTLFFDNFDTNEKAQADYLLNYLAGFGLKLIFLNACDTYSVEANVTEALAAANSKAANKFAVPLSVSAQTTPCFICAKGKIDDEIAIEFSQTFYTHLVNGYSVREAFDKAKQAQKITPAKSKSPNDWHLLGENTDWKPFKTQIDMLAETLFSGLLSLYESGGAEFLKNVGLEIGKSVATDTLKNLGTKALNFFKGKKEAEKELKLLKHAVNEQNTDDFKEQSETVQKLLKEALETDPDFKKEVEAILNGLDADTKKALEKQSAIIVQNSKNIVAGNTFGNITGDFRVGDDYGKK